jgi:hypothetical protein
LDDTRKNNKSVSDPEFKNWLDLVDLFGEHSPVLIFQNEKGGRSKEIDLGGIKSKYDNVRELYKGNLEFPDVVNGLREGIEWYASRLSHVGEELPASWIKIRTEIEAIAAVRPHIGQQEYFDVYSRHLPFSATKALHLSRYLHDLGVFLHFQEDALLSRIVILQNQWATEAVYRMLDDETVKRKSGRFDHADCKRLWNESAYAGMHLELLALMENFELCYTLPDTRPTTWLAPQLLSPVKPVALAGWSQPDDLVLSFRYSFTPKGFIGRLMVRLHRFVLDTNLASVNCVLFQRENTVLMAELLSNGNEIQLRARGPERKALLSVVAAELDAINLRLPGLRDRVGKWIPCNCVACSPSLDPHLFEERALRKRVEDKRLKVECPVSYADMDVLTLLDGIKLPASRTPQKAERVTRRERTIEIFIASSAELAEDRDDLEIYLRQRNDHYLDKGIYLKVVRWENFIDSMSHTRLQDEYNAAVRRCDIFVSMYFTKTGKYTNEEFDAAYEHFRLNSKPKIFTYFKNSSVKSGELKPEDFASLWKFKEKLTTLGHFPTSYDDIEHLKRHFRDQLELILGTVFPTEALSG